MKAKVENVATNGVADGGVNITCIQETVDDPIVCCDEKMSPQKNATTTQVTEAKTSSSRKVSQLTNYVPLGYQKCSAFKTRIYTTFTKCIQHHVHKVVGESFVFLKWKSLNMLMSQHLANFGVVESFHKGTKYVIPVTINRTAIASHRTKLKQYIPVENVCVQKENAERLTEVKINKK